LTAYCKRKRSVLASPCLVAITNSFAYWLSGGFPQVSPFCDEVNSPFAAYSRSFVDFRRAFRDENSQGPKAILLNHSL